MKRDLLISIMFNLLLEELPDKIVVGGLILDIDTDFRAGIKFQLLMEDKELSEISKIKLTCKLFLKEQFKILEEQDYLEAFIKLLDFYLCDEKVKENKNGEDNKVIYSFEHDSKYIFSSFMQAYNINLNKDELHWFEFKTLFDNLPENTIFNKVLGYRVMKIDSSMSKEQQKVYRNLKMQYSLPDMRTEREKETDFVEALW